MLLDLSIAAEVYSLTNLRLYYYSSIITKMNYVRGKLRQRRRELTIRDIRGKRRELKERIYGDA